MAFATLIPEDIMDGLSIQTSYDKITFEISNHHHYIKPSKLNIRGFSHIGHCKKPYSDYFGHQEWGIDVFFNIENGNQIIILLNDDLLRVCFLPEREPFTVKQIESILNVVLDQFRRTVDAIKNDRGKEKVDDPSSIFTPRPLLIEVEVAIDFIGGHTYFLLEELGNYTHRKLARKRTNYSGDDDNYEENNGVTLFNSLRTHYLGGKRSSHASRRYLRVVENIDNPIVRFELILRRNFLRRNGINILTDLRKFNASEYWKENYSFFEIRYDLIKKKLEQVLATGDSIALPMADMYCLCLTENMEPVKVHDLFKKTTDSTGKKLFRNPRRIRRPALQNLHDAVTEALKGLKI